jgi:hypothetical protein
MSTQETDTVAQLLERIATEGQKFVQGDHGARQNLVARARELIFAAEDPMDTLLWHVWLEVRGRRYAGTGS